MAYLVIVERGSNGYGAYVPGCAVVADTRKEVLKLIREAIPLHLESLREHGDPIPEPFSTMGFVHV